MVCRARGPSSLLDNSRSLLERFHEQRPVALGSDGDLLRRHTEFILFKDISLAEPTLVVAELVVFSPKWTAT